MSCSTDALPLSTAESRSEEDSQQVQLSLAFSRHAQDKTFVTRQFSCYPFHIGRAQYVDPAEPDIATVYLQSTSGGVFSGDVLNSLFVVEPRARAHITTQASTVVHSMHEGKASHVVKIVTEAESYIEYLPDPLILFPQADIRSVIDITLDPEATAMVCDAFLSYDPSHNGQPFRKLKNSVRASSPEQETLFVDHFELSGADFNLQSLGMQDQHNVHGNFFVLTKKLSAETMCDEIRAAIQETQCIYGGVSQLPNNCGINVRLLAADCSAMRKAIASVWTTARKLLIGTTPLTRKK